MGTQIGGGMNKKHLIPIKDRQLTDTQKVIEYLDSINQQITLQNRTMIFEIIPRLKGWSFAERNKMLEDIYQDDNSYPEEMKRATSKICLSRLQTFIRRCLTGRVGRV
jgi:hypothetical protein